MSGAKEENRKELIFIWWEEEEKEREREWGKGELILVRDEMFFSFSIFSILFQSKI